VLPARQVAGPDGVGATSAAGSIATPSPTPTPVPLVESDSFGMTFTYPETWTLRDLGSYTSDFSGNLPLQVAHADGFLGNGSSGQTCTDWTREEPAQCTTTWNLPAAGVEISIGQPGWTSTDGSSWSAAAALAGATVPGAESLTIDSMPARFIKNTSNVVPLGGETIPGADEVLWWGIPAPLPSQRTVYIVAALTGPDLAATEAEVTAFVESIRFDRRPVLLPTETPLLEAARQAVLDQFFASYLSAADDEHNHSLDCFPKVVGVAKQASITQTLNTAPMTQPLPVTCEIVSVDPNAMQGWTIVARQDWAAGADYPAGSAGMTCTTQADGTNSACYYGMTYYPHVGKSKHKG
jgi:hypothetical protein